MTTPDDPAFSYETAPELYLFTSLTAGSSHIITATSRLETILKANRVPFLAVDCATDEKARRIWSRRSKGRKLPGLVKQGLVVGDLAQIEEWNEDGVIKTHLGGEPLPPKMGWEKPKKKKKKAAATTDAADAAGTADGATAATADSSTGADANTTASGEKDATTTVASDAPTAPPLPDASTTLPIRSKEGADASTSSATTTTSSPLSPTKKETPQSRGANLAQEAAAAVAARRKQKIAKMKEEMAAERAAKVSAGQSDPGTPATPDVPVTPATVDAPSRAEGEAAANTEAQAEALSEAEAKAKTEGEAESTSKETTEAAAALKTDDEDVSDNTEKVILPIDAKLAVEDKAVKDADAAAQGDADTDTAADQQNVDTLGAGPAASSKADEAENDTSNVNDTAAPTQTVDDKAIEDSDASHDTGPEVPVASTVESVPTTSAIAASAASEAPPITSDTSDTPKHDAPDAMPSQSNAAVTTDTNANVDAAPASSSGLAAVTRDPDVLASLDAGNDENEPFPSPHIKFKGRENEPGAAETYKKTHSRSGSTEPPLAESSQHIDEIKTTVFDAPTRARASSASADKPDEDSMRANEAQNLIEETKNEETATSRRSGSKPIIDVPDEETVRAIEAENQIDEKKDEESGEDESSEEDETGDEDDSNDAESDANAKPTKTTTDATA